MPDHKDLSNDPRSVLGRLTGLPFLPYEPAFIKRVIGLPGDTLKVVKGVGVYINGQLLEEPYIKEKPNYDLRTLGDIGNTGHIPYDGRPPMTPQAAAGPIVIPKDDLFMMGDNRNNSQDSHVWGFLDQNRVIGRAFLVFWRKLDPPPYPLNLQSGDPDSGH
jgi:signal peptidase I